MGTSRGCKPAGSELRGHLWAPPGAPVPPSDGSSEEVWVLSVSLCVCTQLLSVRGALSSRLIVVAGRRHPRV